MSRAFILITLAERDIFTFGNATLSWVKQKYPAVLVLDIDSYSDTFLVNQACDLLKNSDSSVVYFKVLSPNLPLGASFQLLETSLQLPDKTSLFLEGEHRQVNAICSARPNVKFKIVESEAPLQEAIEVIWN